MVVGVALAATAVAACGTSEGEARSAAPETLKVVGPFEVHSLDPSTSDGFFTRLQVAETLVDADTEGTLRPGLAHDWDVSADQLTWAFEVRPGATFHDGTEVTGDAVAAALEVAREKPDTPLSTAPVTRIGSEGDVVRVELREPFAPLPSVLAHTSTQILAPSSYGPDDAVTTVVGSGPYRVERVEQPSQIDVAAFDQWDGEQPAIEKVSYQAVGRSESRALMAESGQAHVTFGMDPVGLQRIKNAEDVEVNAVTLPRTIQLKANAEHEILGDVRVRRALSLALDREAMATALLRDPEMAATQLFPPSLPDWHQESLDPLVHDEEEASDLLAQAGWTPDKNGVLQRDGERLRISLRTFPDRPELPVIATAVQADLEELGVKVDVEVGNSSAIPAGHQDGSLELGLYARNFALVPDPLVTLLEDFGPRGADWGAMGWSDPGLSGTLEEMAGGVAPEEAADGREDVAQILQDELPVIPIAWYRQSAVVDDRLDGFDLDPLERSWLISDLTWSS
jgi:peptide/nickel transport system substrate-binding protein